MDREQRRYVLPVADVKSPMTLTFAALCLVQQSDPGSIPHLKPNQIAVVSMGGGQLGFVAKLTVYRDGTVEYVTSARQLEPRSSVTKITPGEVNALRFLIGRTDFAALHRGPRAKYPPSAADGIDRGIAVRRGDQVRGWTNKIWVEPTARIPLFEKLDSLIPRNGTR